MVEDRVKSNSFFRKEDQSVWVDLTAEGLDQKKSIAEGRWNFCVYPQDIGTAQLRSRWTQGTWSVNLCCGNEQDYHFKVPCHFPKLQRPWADGLYHLSYGMVDLPSGKMKSREGTVVDADDLMKDVVEEAEMATKTMVSWMISTVLEARELSHTWNGSD